MSSSQTLTLDPIIGGVNPGRASKGITATFTADANGPIIDKRGYGLVGISWPAFTTAVTLTFKVGLTSALLRTHDAVSITVSAAGATGTSDLAEWPFIQPILNAADTGSIQLALS